MAEQQLKTSLQLEDKNFSPRMKKSCQNAKNELSKLKGAFQITTAAVSAFSGGIGGLVGSLASCTSPMGAAVTAANALIGALSDGCRSATEFNTKQSELKAVTGMSAGQLSVLTDQAKQLGSTTAYTAGQVTELQISLARLGFDSGEIEQMTGQVLSFATAMNIELGPAAEQVGSTLRQFGLDASQTSRVVDVLSKSCTLSALNAEYLQTAMSTVGPVANAMGYSIEDTTAMLGVLANAGFDASSASTALRNILLTMADPASKLSVAIGRPVKSAKDFSEALSVMQAKGISVAEALELTDKRSVAAFETLISGSETVGTLSEALQGAEGACQKMADTMSDNLEGDVKGLSSAWEGLMLNIFGSQGILRTITQATTKFVQTCNDGLQSVIRWWQDLYNESVVVRLATQSIGVAFKATVNSMISGMKQVFNAYKTVAKIISSILKGDFKGAGQAFADGFKAGAGEVANFVSNVSKSVKDAGKEIKDGKYDTASKPTKKTDTTAPKTTKTATDTSGESSSGSGGGSGKSSTAKTKSAKEEIKFIEGSLDDLENRLSEAKKRLSSGLFNSGETVDSLKTLIADLQKEIDKKELELGFAEPKESEAEKTAKKLTDDLKSKLKDKPVSVNYETKIKGVNDAEKSDQDKISDNDSKINNNLKSIQDLQTVIDEAKEKAAELNATINAEGANPTEDEINAYNDLLSTIDEVIAKKQELVEANDGLISTNDALADKVSKQTKQVKKNEQAYEALGNVSNALGSLSGAIQQLGEDNAGLQAFGIALYLAGAMAAMAQQLTKCVTVWDYIAAIAAGTAAVVSSVVQFQQLGASYAQGGIIEGPYSVGDKMTLANVNGGEMILNDGQQRRLWNMINGNSTIGNDGNLSSSNVEFTIKGKDLIGVLSNNERRRSHIR